MQQLLGKEYCYEEKEGRKEGKMLCFSFKTEIAKQKHF
jgi:hypothetical protein